MAITFQLVEATPDRLMYLASQDGVISSPPVVADGLGVIPNAGGASPDLQTDALSVGSSATPDFDISGIPILGPINANRNGYGPFVAGTIAQAQASALFGPEDPGGLLNPLIAPCQVDVQGRSGTIAWAVGAGPSVGVANPFIQVASSVGAVGTAYVRIQYLHSYDS